MDKKADRGADREATASAADDAARTGPESILGGSGAGAKRVRDGAGTSGVQSLERAFELLEHLADSGREMGLSELAGLSGLPLPTVHRLMRTLSAREYVRQEPSRRYVLGPRLIRLGEAASRFLGSWARPHLVSLVESTGETANLALLDGDEVVYVAQVPSKHSMRMFTEVGRRVLPHCTAVGKALLAQLPPADAAAILARTGMPPYTPHTVTDPQELLGQLERIRAQGYAVDDGEQEVGVRCVAVPVLGAPTLAAISVSGPQTRVSARLHDSIIPVVRSAAEQLTASLSARDAAGP
ncbi:MAG: IclR family transcriptional regulator [Actinomycetota bacterium]|nr:IclR family transcriptional regulator [Actinomycetota bacterium]